MVAPKILAFQVWVQILVGVLIKFITMNESEAKNQAQKALKELNKALLLLYPYRNNQWALNFLDEVNLLSVKY